MIHGAARHTRTQCDAQLGGRQIASAREVLHAACARWKSTLQLSATFIGQHLDTDAGRRSTGGYSLRIFLDVIPSRLWVTKDGYLIFILLEVATGIRAERLYVAHILGAAV